MIPNHLSQHKFKVQKYKVIVLLYVLEKGEGGYV